MSEMEMSNEQELRVDLASREDDILNLAEVIAEQHRKNSRLAMVNRRLRHELEATEKSLEHCRRRIDVLEKNVLTQSDTIDQLREDLDLERAREPDPEQANDEGYAENA